MVMSVSIKFRIFKTIASVTVLLLHGNVLIKSSHPASHRYLAVSVTL
jgi:hypothetical protein